MYKQIEPMETLPLILLIIAVFAFIFWFARRATINNHKQMRLLTEHFGLNVQQRKSFWQLPILTGELNGFSLQIKVEPNSNSEANEMEVLLQVPRQAFNLIIRRRLKLGKQKTDVELMDAQVDDYYVIKTEYPQKAKTFLQDREIKQELYKFKDDMMLGTSIRLHEGQMRYLMTFANVGDNKRQKIIRTIELMGFLAGRLA